MLFPAPIDHSPGEWEGVYAVHDQLGDTSRFGMS